MRVGSKGSGLRRDFSVGFPGSDAELLRRQDDYPLCALVSSQNSTNRARELRNAPAKEKPWKASCTLCVSGEPRCPSRRPFFGAGTATGPLFLVPFVSPLVFVICCSQASDGSSSSKMSEGASFLRFASVNSVSKLACPSLNPY